MQFQSKSATRMVRRWYLAIPIRPCINTKICLQSVRHLLDGRQSTRFSLRSRYTQIQQSSAAAIGAKWAGIALNACSARGWLQYALDVEEQCPVNHALQHKHTT